MTTQSLPKEICVRGILTWDEYNLNIIAYYWSLEYCPGAACRGQLPYLGI